MKRYDVELGEATSARCPGPWPMAESDNGDWVDADEALATEAERNHLRTREAELEAENGRLRVRVAEFQTEHGQLLNVLRFFGCEQRGKGLLSMCRGCPQQRGTQCGLRPEGESH